MNDLHKEAIEHADHLASENMLQASIVMLKLLQQRDDLMEALNGLIECPRGKLQWENAQETVKRIDQ